MDPIVQDKAIVVIQSTYRRYSCRRYLFVAQVIFSRIEDRLRSPLIELPSLSLVRYTYHPLSNF